MRGLAYLIRLHRWKLEEQRRKLVALEALLAGFLQQIRTLDEEASGEAQNTGKAPDTAHMLGGYLQASRERRNKLRASAANVDNEIAESRTHVNAAFRELKRFELVQAERERWARHQARRRERIAEDEVGIGIYRRRSRSAG